MNKFFLSIIALLLVCLSCGTAKKVQQEDTTIAVDSALAVLKTTTTNNKVIDTTYSMQGKMTITEFEFFPPDTGKDNQTSDVDVPSFGKVKGNLKNVKQTVIENNLERKGTSEESDTTEAVEQQSAVKKEEAKVAKVVEPTGDPYKWRYIFYLASLFVAMAVFLYLKRAPILNWIKKILSGIRRIF